VLSGGKDRTLRLWDVAGGKEVGRLVGHTSAVTCLAASPDGRRALSGGKDKTVRYWDLDGLRELAACGRTRGASAAWPSPRTVGKR
jgi:WD40 repeat protein